MNWTNLGYDESHIPKPLPDTPQLVAVRTALNKESRETGTLKILFRSRGNRKDVMYIGSLL